MNDGLLSFVDKVVQNAPSDWLKLTTHRIDTYNEPLAKTEFLDKLEELYASKKDSSEVLKALPTAYDYIRLGHPFSCLLEWMIAKMNQLPANNVIAFASKTMPLFAVLRSNLLSNIKTRIVLLNSEDLQLNSADLNNNYGYSFEVLKVNDLNTIESFDGVSILIASENELSNFSFPSNIDFIIKNVKGHGSIIAIHPSKSEEYTGKIQHIRRRESIAMTPEDALDLINTRFLNLASNKPKYDRDNDRIKVVETIQSINNCDSSVLLASSGLSTQYAIIMGLIDYCMSEYPDKAIKIIVPPNCYGGTNNQARRVAECLDNVSVMDLPVDGENDMVQSTETILEEVAKLDGIPLIIAEIPTNPRVEVPDLNELSKVLSQKRSTSEGIPAKSPVFILDQTFCPNIQFLSEESVLSNSQIIAYVSGSKFPSGGKCTAGYTLANRSAQHLISAIEKHLTLCDNQATPQQVAILAEQLPSMLVRINEAYKNTRAFVNHIQEELPTAKINFVSNELADKGFTPSVFSLDLPTKGDSDQERELYKRSLNQKLIDMMITQIPNESKYCVSYGQLKGCYWTIPATSTQGTTKEADKDYIARVSVSPDFDLEKHKAVFSEFVNEI